MWLSTSQSTALTGRTHHSQIHTATAGGRGRGWGWMMETCVVGTGVWLCNRKSSVGWQWRWLQYNMNLGDDAELCRYLTMARMAICMKGVCGRMCACVRVCACVQVCVVCVQVCVWCAWCMCTCEHVYVHVCTSVCGVVCVWYMCVSEMSPTVLHLFLWDRVSSWTWDIFAQLGWKSSSPSHLQFPRSWGHRPAKDDCLAMWMLGSKF